MRQTELTWSESSDSHGQKGSLSLAWLREVPCKAEVACRMIYGYSQSQEFACSYCGVLCLKHYGLMRTGK